MYSTKLINNRLVDKNAYITIGDPYQDPKPNPFRNAAPLKKDEKALTPFQITYKPSNAENGCFTKVEYKGGDISDVIHYIQTQPLDTRKNGFGTKDAKRRDEFANAMRTEQYRATIRREHELIKEQAKAYGKKKSETIVPESPESPTHDDKELLLFDRCRADANELSFDPRQKRDTFFKQDRNHGMRLGGLLKPTSADWGSGVGDVKYRAPEFGGHSTIKHFFDRSHLHK